MSYVSIIIFARKEENKLKQFINQFHTKHDYKNTFSIRRKTKLSDNNTSKKRAHSEGPEWASHCWDHNSNHVMDPFCALLTTTSKIYRLRYS